MAENDESFGGRGRSAVLTCCTPDISLTSGSGRRHPPWLERWTRPACCGRPQLRTIKRPRLSALCRLGCALGRLAAFSTAEELYFLVLVLSGQGVELLPRHPGALSSRAPNALFSIILPPGAGQGVLSLLAALEAGHLGNISLFILVGGCLQLALSC